MTSFDLLMLMKKIRWAEEQIAEEYTKWEMRCPVHLSVGQEGVAAAVGLAARKDDFMVSGHRAHAHYLGKGGSLERMIAELFGKVTGCARGKGGSMHLTDPSVGFTGSTAIVANTIPVGVGLGLSIQLKKTDQVSFVCFGDGAVEEGAFYEAANFAALRKLPVLFICENNFYSVYSHLRSRQPEGRDLCRLAKEIGIPSARVDGNDALTVFSSVSEQIQKARAGGGPFFFELPTYRWREHCGPNYDNDIGYRTEAEFLEWKAKDPVERLEKSLLANSSSLQTEITMGEGHIRKQIADAFAFARSSEFPSKDELEMHVWKARSELHA